MHIVRFRAGDEARHGVIEGSHIVEYVGTPYGTFRKARKKYPLKQSVLLAPVVPSKVVAVGLNYRDHAQEQNLPVPSEPIIFLKPLSALSGPDDPIVFPPQAKRVDYEDLVENDRAGRRRLRRLRQAVGVSLDELGQDLVAAG